MWVRFSAFVQTGPEAQLALCAMGRGISGLFPRGNWLGCGVNRPALSSTEVKENVELYFCAFMASYSVTFTCTLLLHIMYKTFSVTFK
jgi:hypothetical protein